MTSPPPPGSSSSSSLTCPHCTVPNQAWKMQHLRLYLCQNLLQASRGGGPRVSQRQDLRGEGGWAATTVWAFSLRGDNRAQESSSAMCSAHVQGQVSGQASVGRKRSRGWHWKCSKGDFTASGSRWVCFVGFPLAFEPLWKFLAIPLKAAHRFLARWPNAG